MRDEGNVAVELIFAVMLMCVLVIPAISTIAEFADARRDLTVVGNLYMRAWYQNGERPSITPFESMTHRSISVTSTCLPNCTDVSARISVRFSTDVWLLQTFSITETQSLVLNEFG